MRPFFATIAIPFVVAGSVGLFSDPAFANRVAKCEKELRTPAVTKAINNLEHPKKRIRNRARLRIKQYYKMYSACLKERGSDNTR
ncbi:MAG: hypothetical protein AAFQ42_08665 [Pseudomonadota bacterium]